MPANPFFKLNPPYLFQPQFFILSFILLFLNYNANSQGYLRADGKRIVNEKGENVLLRGMGLGGWMLQEGYMLRVSNIGQQYNIRARIGELIGPEKTQEFYGTWLENGIRKIDIDSMASWGFNSVRLPMHYNLFTLPVDQEPVEGKNTWLEKGFRMTDSLLSWCRTNNMYLILDLHATPGGQGNDLNISDRDPSKPSLWESEANRKKMIELWVKLAQRYADEPNIGGYDIINEPNWGFEDPKNDFRGTEEKMNVPLKQLMMDITKAIRTVDKKHIIIIEGNGFGNNYNGILPAWDKNMVLSFHKYGNYNDKASIQRFLDLRDKFNIPLWMGESGENSNVWFTNAIRLVEDNNIGWSWWPLKKIGVNNPLEIKLNPGYQHLLDYWNGKGEKPSSAEAYQALMELADNIKLEDCIYHKGVTDAMFRQVHSAASVPFSSDKIGTKTLIKAVNYDLGRNKFAYFDEDTASYQYVNPPVRSSGNKGHVYRNDGVDIYKTAGSDSDLYVGSIADNEWLKYSLNVAKAGTYEINISLASDNPEGLISVYSDNAMPAKAIRVPDTGGLENWNSLTIKDVKLHDGINQIRLKADKGGFNLKSLEFVLQ